ncbi:CrpP-related protein [Achromobacter kerstersii]|uniref:CrpP-related protein n=1 Tax=Achromobacter kerstersii TaxID=1353890 RepID=UPI003B84642F
MFEEIQREGAWAARNGISSFECPYLCVPMMAEANCQSPYEGVEYVEAWRKGWRDEVQGWIFGTRIGPVSGRRGALH